LVEAQWLEMNTLLNASRGVLLLLQWLCELSLLQEPLLHVGLVAQLPVLFSHFRQSVNRLFVQVQFGDHIIYRDFFTLLSCLIA
jgi:hypothetical protein